MTLAELLAKADLANDLEFKDAGGNALKLGDLRAFSSSLDTERTSLKNALGEAQKTALEAKNLKESFEQALQELAKNSPKQEDGKKGPDWRKNPLYEELIPFMDSMEQTVKAANEQVTTLKKSLEQSQAIYSLERMRRQWAEATVKPKDKTFEQAAQEILAAKEVDELGLPTMNKYLQRATEPDRIAAAVKEAVDKARTEWDAKQRIASVKPSGNGTKFSTHKSGEPPIKKIDDLTSDVIANDPDIAKLMEGPVQ